MTHAASRGRLVRRRPANDNRRSGGYGMAWLALGLSACVVAWLILA